ncbi:NAD(P)-binding protein [Limtongia smithiae]|uniref:NAD(P)-binding protein n=1 Tax=Limtongia smithiae TaxID=1125753 RepID=UPI0034CEB098
MKVLILGAAGFIGKPTAQAFAAAGYETYGQSRDPAAGVVLQQDEITPLIGTPVEIIEKHGAEMDVIIDCVMSGVGGAVALPIFDAVLAVAATRSPVRKLAFIFTSGTWTEGMPAGSDPLAIVSEVSPLGPEIPELVQWRAEFETKILSAPATVPGLCPIIIRPALLYGRSASLLSDLFAQAHANDVITWPGEPGITRYSTVHQDDLARLFVLVAERAPLFNGLCVDGVNPQTELLEDIIRSLITAAGGNKTFVLREPEGAYEIALTTKARHAASLGYTLAGWVPRKPSLVDGIKRYYETWKSYQ